MPGKLAETDRDYLQMAVELSHGYGDDQRTWPFGALVVVGGQIAGKGINRVVELHDPAAHAEVMALRAAGRALGRHAFEARSCIPAASRADVPRGVLLGLAFSAWYSPRRATTSLPAACGTWPSTKNSGSRPRAGPCTKMQARTTCGGAPGQYYRTGPGTIAPRLVRDTTEGSHDLYFFRTGGGITDHRGYQPWPVMCPRPTRPHLMAHMAHRVRRRWCWPGLTAS
jgi:hypothetical protein